MGNIWQIMILIIGLLISLAGVILVFDARIITKTFFGFGDQNEASMGLKIFGFVFSLVGAFLCYFIVR